MLCKELGQNQITTQVKKAIQKIFSVLCAGNSSCSCSGWLTQPQPLTQGPFPQPPAAGDWPQESRSWMVHSVRASQACRPCLSLAPDRNWVAVGRSQASKPCQLCHPPMSPCRLARREAENWPWRGLWLSPVHRSSPGYSHRINNIGWPLLWMTKPEGNSRKTLRKTHKTTSSAMKQPLQQFSTSIANGAENYSSSTRSEGEHSSWWNDYVGCAES